VEWFGGGGIPDEVIVVDSVPHHWLFSRIQGTVHHGGAGTTAASLRAGVPTLVVPFFGDQFFWGWRVETLGVGPAPLPYKRLSPQSLAQALRILVTTDCFKHKAADISLFITKEGGTGKAVDIPEQYLNP